MRRELSQTEQQIARLRYDEWIRERKNVGVIVLGGQLVTDGWGKPDGFRVLGYKKSFDKAVEISMDRIGLKLPNEVFYAEMKLQLWTPSGPTR